MLEDRPSGRFPSLGRSDVPNSNVDAAIIDMAVIDQGDRGDVTIFRCGAVPNASCLGLTTGGVIANEVIARLSPTGAICAYTSATTHLAIDVVGLIPAT